MKPRAKADAAPMTDTVAAILLGGWSAEPPDGGEHGFADGLLDLAFMDEQQIAELWRTHDRYLRKNAERLAIEPRFDGGAAGPVFFGEYLGRHLAQRSARG